MQRCVCPIFWLLAAAIMCSVIVEQLEARRIGQRLQGDRSVHTETAVHKTQDLSAGRYARSPRLQRRSFGDEQELAVERKAVKVVEQLEKLQDSIGDKVGAGTGGHQSDCGGCGEEAKAKRLETKNHQIVRIVSGADINVHDDEDSEDDDDDDDDDDSRKRKKRQGSNPGSLDAVAVARTKADLSAGEIGARTSRLSRKKRRVMKIFSDKEYAEGKYDDDDDDEDEDDDDENEDEEDAGEGDENVEIIEYEGEPRKKKKPKVKFVPVPVPIVKNKHHHHQKEPVLRLPPDVIEAMHQVQRAKLKPKAKHKQAIHIIEVMKKEEAPKPAPAAPPAAPAAPAAAAAPAPPPPGPPPPPSKINVA